MRAVKQALDPRGLMNPGKLVPERVKPGADVEQYLQALGIPFERHEHPPVATVAEAEAHWAGIDAVHAKNLFLRNHKGTRHFLVVLAAARTRRPGRRWRRSSASASWASPRPSGCRSTSAWRRDRCRRSG